MARPFRFYLTSTPPEQLVSALEVHPGVKVRNDQVWCSENSAFLVNTVLKENKAKFKVWFAPEPPGISKASIDNLVVSNGLREWVPDFLLPYQVDGLYFSATKDGAMLLHATGAGKSLSAIVWSLLAPLPAIIVTRAMNRRNFAREITKYTTHSPLILEGETSSPIDLGNRCFIIISWEILPAWLKELQKIKPVSVVFDESHRGKAHRRWEAIPVTKEEENDPDVVDLNGRKIKYRKLENIASAAADLSRTAKRRLATTATPIRDRLRDLWAQLDLIEPWGFGSYWNFARRYCDAKPNPWGGMDDTGRSNLDELVARLSFLIHEVPYSVSNGQLPAKRRHVVTIPVSDQDRPASFKAELKSVAERGGAGMIELRLAEAATRKRTFVIEHAIDALRNGQKVVVFTGRRKDCEKLAEDLGKRLDKEKVEARVWWGHGGVAANDRDVMIEAYMKEDGASILIGTGDAFGESISLQRTDLLIMAMLPYTPGQIVQREGRVTRLGQDRPVLILYPICEETYDEHVAEILINKLPAVEKVVGDEELSSLGAELRSGGKTDDEIIDSLIEKLNEKVEDLE